MTREDVRPLDGGVIGSCTCVSWRRAEGDGVSR